MARTVAIGLQDFETVRQRDVFYIDKTYFLKEWWNAQDDVTLITRPRRFGKTLTMSMTEKFFSINYAGRKNLFDGLSVAKDEAFMELQGSYPVISLTFSNIKEGSYADTRKKICYLLVNLYSQYYFLRDSGILTVQEQEFFDHITVDMEDTTAAISIQQLSEYLYRYYHKKVIILLDEYDTPMQEAWLGGFWNETVFFIRNLFNATFKGNPYLERAIMTGITRVSKESIFSELNHLKVVTATSDEYADCFGFTEQEVYQALDEYGMTDRMPEVKRWYDGFTFGNTPDIYNPWSIINYLDTLKLRTYWANTSSNALVGKLIREGSKDIKQRFERLMRGDALLEQIDEQLVYSQLPMQESAIWSLLLASGYVTATSTDFNETTGVVSYYLKLTNKEVHIMFATMIRGWFSDYDSGYNDFIKAMLLDDLDAMNEYMNRVALTTFSFFDTGTHPEEKTEPERFYHGFVLGLMVDLADKFTVTSNRESGFGRYDVVLEPRDNDLDAIIIEFKVFNPRKEHTLEDTVQNALEQIEAKEYVTALKAKGIPAKRIRSYGFAFEGKTVLIGK